MTSAFLKRVLERTWRISLLIVLCGDVRAGGSGPPPEGPKRVANCFGEQFAEGPGPFHLVRPSPEQSPAFIPADDACLNADADACRKHIPLDKSHAWFAGAHAGGWVCVTDGRQFGWTRESQVTLGPIPAALPGDWRGDWKAEFGDVIIAVTPAVKGKGLHVKAGAEWRARPDVPPHLGELDADGELVANELRLGEPRCLDLDYGEAHRECLDCVARLMLINDRVFVKDNRMCGGMNVNFDGIYDRAKGSVR